MWFLHSPGEDRVAGHFPSQGSLIAEMDTFAATSEQDVDRKSSYKGGLAAGGLIFLLMLSGKRRKTAMKTEFSPTFEGQLLVTTQQFSCKNNILIFI